MHVVYFNLFFKKKIVFLLILKFRTDYMLAKRSTYRTFEQLSTTVNFNKK